MNLLSLDETPSLETQKSNGVDKNRQGLFYLYVYYLVQNNRNGNTYIGRNL